MSEFEIEKAENLACGEDFCFICGRPTDHLGEHSPEQIEAWVMKPGIMQDVFWAAP
jgi:hypothetical protein